MKKEMSRNNISLGPKTLIRALQYNNEREISSACGLKGEGMMKSKLFRESYYPKIGDFLLENPKPSKQKSSEKKKSKGKK